MGVRPEDISIHTEVVNEGSEFQAYSVLPSGADTTIIARRGKLEISVKEIGVSKVAMDQKIWLTFNKDTVNLYDKLSGNLISG